MRQGKTEKGKRIVLGRAVQQRLAPMLAQVNQYLQAVRDTLNVPDGWLLENDQRGNPVAFVPPPEPPEGPKKVVKKKKKQKRG